jgi:glycerol kinase
VEDNGGAYFVPAFSGLFAPYWRSDARGVIAGLTRYVTKAHLARAVLEATAWQTREIADAMLKDSGTEVTTLKVDGGMTANNLLMQTLSDFLDVPVVLPMVSETTCLGAAYAAGLAIGFWPDTEALRANWRRAAEWTPHMDAGQRDSEYRQWLKAVQSTMGWLDDESAPRG